MRSSYLDYAMSVIVGRALPDVRDGLKPVHRRALFSMNENGLQPNRPYVKSARIVGDVMGKYHPHGDSAIYDTIVRMAQDFSLRYPLVDGQGNFGSVDDDPAAAMRYTEARLAPIAREMLRDLDSDTVDFGPNYDGSEQEPLVLPARFPNLLVNGSSGIAVGMATNIPPHNLKETIAATIAFIENPDIDVPGLMQHMKGPDFPTGGVILGLSRHPRRLRDRPRPRAGARHRAHRADPRQPRGDRGHRAAVHGQEGRRRRRHQEDRRAGQREEADRDLRRPGPLGPQRHADRDRAQARREPEGRAQQALQAHADADHVRREHGRAGRERPAAAVAARGHPQLRPPPARGHRPPGQARAARRSSARVHRARGPADRARQPRRGDRADPRLARPRHGAHRADGALRDDRDPGPRGPRPAPAAADRASRPTRCARSTRTRWSGSASCASCSATRTWSSS